MESKGTGGKKKGEGGGEWGEAREMETEDD